MQEKLIFIGRGRLLLSFPPFHARAGFQASLYSANIITELQKTQSPMMTTINVFYSHTSLICFTFHN